MLPDPTEPPSWSDDSKAKAEENNWNDEARLRGQRTKNDHRWLCVYGWVVICLTVIFSALFVASVAVWAWHFLAPARLLWLGPEQLTKIQSILFSGGLGAVLSGIAQKQLSK